MNEDRRPVYANQLSPFMISDDLQTQIEKALFSKFEKNTGEISRSTSLGHLFT